MLFNSHEPLRTDAFNIIYIVTGIHFNFKFLSHFSTINSDEHSEYFREITSHHVKVNLGFKSSHLESTSCMNLTDMVNYNWPQVKSTENLIAVHQSGEAKTVCQFLYTKNVLPIW